MKIGVLEAGPVNPVLAETWGQYGDVFRRWLAPYAPGDAVADVIHRHGGLDARRLSDARRAVSSDHQPLLAGALDHGLEKAAILAHHLDGHPLADDVIEYLARHDIAHRIDLFLGVHAAWQVPARVPELLAQDSTMALGLMLATWLPTLEVLEALLAWAPPEGDMWTQAYANALASMGDPAVMPRLRALVEEQPETTAEARQLIEHILHQPLL